MGPVGSHQDLLRAFPSILKDGSGEMAQPVKTLAAKPDYLSLISRTHMVEEGSRLSQAFLPHTFAVVCMRVSTHNG